MSHYGRAATVAAGKCDVSVLDMTAFPLTHLRKRKLNPTYRMPQGQICLAEIVWQQSLIIVL